MNSYMKELKSKIPSIVTQRGLDVDHVQVKGSKLIIHLASESQVVKARAMRDEIRQIIDADGAGYKTEFNSYTDMWSKREGYNNTRGVEAEVQFTTLNWGS